MNTPPKDRASQHDDRVTIDISWIGFPPAFAQAQPFSRPNVNAVVTVDTLTAHFEQAGVLAAPDATKVSRDGRTLQLRVPSGPYAAVDQPRIRQAYEDATREMGTPRTLTFTGSSGSPVPVSSSRGPSDLLGSFFRWLASRLKNDD